MFFFKSKFHYDCSYLSFEFPLRQKLNGICLLQVLLVVDLFLYQEEEGHHLPSYAFPQPAINLLITMTCINQILRAMCLWENFSCHLTVDIVTLIASFPLPSPFLVLFALAVRL